MKAYHLCAFLLCFFFSSCIFAQKLITFPHACTHGKHLVIAAVGDVLLHQPLQMKAAKSGFESLWSNATPYLKLANITFGNLEGPMAAGVSKAGRLVKDPGHRWDNHVYSSFPLFNYHPKLASALKNSGFDIMSTANNHTLDRYAVGIDRTIDVLNQTGLQFSGTRQRGSQKPWYTIVKSKGFKVAWISCAAMTNGMKDKHKQVLLCYRRNDRRLILKTIGELRSQVDAVIVTPHWGTQYKFTPNSHQKRFARQVLNAGALAVIGTHPHVLQPMQRYRTKDGRDTFIAYSLGNFVSYQGTPKNRSTVILYVTLVKTRDGTKIANIRFIPAYMQNRSGIPKIRLTLLTPQEKKSIGYQIISRLLPMGNAVFARDVSRDTLTRCRVPPSVQL